MAPMKQARQQSLKISPEDMRIWVQGSISGVPTFVPTRQTDGHSQAQPATCYDHG